MGCSSRLAGKPRRRGRCPLYELGTRRKTMMTKANQEREIPRKPKKRSSKSVVRIQYGALPYRFTPEASLEILLVTTRQTKRWIIPKGWPIKRLKPAKSAAREAFEEAGVRGKIGMKSVGLFAYEKA